MPDPPAEQSASAGTESPESEPISPARARAADQTVKRATGGLIRLDSRRRLRSFLRRSLYFVLIVVPLAGLVYWFAEDIVDLLVAYWERIESKLPPSEASEAPKR